jgi:hypothetical protein
VKFVYLRSSRLHFPIICLDSCIIKKGEQERVRKVAISVSEHGSVVDGELACVQGELVVFFELLFGGFLLFV